MSFRAREIYKKVVRRVGGEGKLPAEVMDTVKSILPNSKVVMGRAKRHLRRPPHPVRQQGLRGRRQQVKAKLEAKRSGETSFQLYS
ncbi:hypothetical protein ZWY2020_019791 [Hordeum vulgare]|nr:hypothetical protein ZWY2020_019791 [Hordeum vulgare]